MTKTLSMPIINSPPDSVRLKIEFHMQFVVGKGFAVIMMDGLLIVLLCVVWITSNYKKLILECFVLFAVASICSDAMLIILRSLRLGRTFLWKKVFDWNYTQQLIRRFEFKFTWKRSEWSSEPENKSSELTTFSTPAVHFSEAIALSGAKHSLKTYRRQLENDFERETKLNAKMKWNFFPIHFPSTLFDSTISQFTWRQTVCVSDYKSEKFLLHLRRGRKNSIPNK